MGDISKISTALTETVKDGELQNVTLDLAEVLSDSFLDDGILKDIPVLGTLTGIYKASHSIHDKLLIKKLVHFLTKLKDIPKDKRHKQIEKIEQSSKYRTKVGEKLLFIIDKCDDSEKAELIGKLFNAFLEEKIDYDDFQRGVVCIDKAFLPDLIFFITSNWTNLFVDDGGSQYLSYGLMELVPIDPQIEADNTKAHFIGYGDPEYRIKNIDLKCEITSVGKIIRQFLK